jgi:hypothetical protein
MKKALHTAKVVCKVLIFNTLCISIFCFLVPILVIFRLVENIISILSDCYTALKEENIKIMHDLEIDKKNENNKTQAHVLGEKLKESVRNN